MMKFYICKHCGNVITKLTSSQVPVQCCGENMQPLEAGVTDAAVEKHVPVVTVEGNLVPPGGDAGGRVRPGGGPAGQGGLCLLQSPRSVEGGAVISSVSRRAGTMYRPVFFIRYPWLRSFQPRLVARNRPALV